MTARFPTPRFDLPAVALLAFACGGGGGVMDSARDDAPDRDSLRPRYIAGVVGTPGSLSGVVEWEMREGIVVDVDRCASGRNRRLVNEPPDAVAWIAGIGAGKAIALDRLSAIVAHSCGLRPVVQPAFVGGAINVRNSDTTEHLLRFIDDRGRRVRELQLIPGDMVVPLRDVLSQARRLRIECARHPDERAWLLVFDHPYVAATADRRFEMDSVPPGRYRLVIWDPGRGIVEDSVIVEPGEETEIRLRFRH